MRVAAALICSLACVLPARAQPGWAAELEAGRGELVDVVRVGLRTPSLSVWTVEKDLNVALALTSSVARWIGTDSGAARRLLWDLGVAPLIRLQRSPDAEAWAPYLEAGLGLHLLNGTSISPLRQLGIHFQFGELIGAGLHFGRYQRLEVGLRIQHESNADLARENAGLTYASISFGRRF